MDIPSSPVLSELVLKLHDAFSIHDFVETGTFLGVTAHWASRRFDQVYSIEASQELWQRAVQSYAGIPNLKFLQGDSRMKLAELLPRLVPPPIFWLDAHWSAGITYGEQDECPLLGELAAIRGLLGQAFIMIDDASLFLAPPPRPHSIHAWPDIRTVLENLTSPSVENYVVIFDDVIFSAPACARTFLASYCQEVSTLRSGTRSAGKRSFSQRLLARLRGV